MSMRGPRSEDVKRRHTYAIGISRFRSALRSVVHRKCGECVECGGGVQSLE